MEVWNPMVDSWKGMLNKKKKKNCFNLEDKRTWNPMVDSWKGMQNNKIKKTHSHLIPKVTMGQVEMTKRKMQGVIKY